MQNKRAEEPLVRARIVAGAVLGALAATVIADLFKRSLRS